MTALQSHFVWDVHNLIYRYAELIDEGDFEGLGSLFSRGSLSFSPGGISLHGAVEVADFYQRVVQIDADTGTPRTVHRVYNSIITPASGGWQARSRYDVLHRVNDTEVKLVAFGRYFDTFQVVANECCFKTRKVVSEFLGDTERHINEPVLRRGGATQGNSFLTHSQ